MDGLTTNGVLIMHPKGKFCGGNAKCGLWRETSLGGEVFSLRESRSAQQKGQPVSITQCNSYKLLPKEKGELLMIFLFFHPLWSLQIKDETNILQDGTLIDLCGATLLWRSSEGLQTSPVSVFS
jgi:pellino